MLLLFSIRVAELPPVRVFRERLSNFVCVLFSLLWGVGCGM